MPLNLANKQFMIIFISKKEAIMFYKLQLSIYFVKTNTNFQDTYNL